MRLGRSVRARPKWSKSFGGKNKLEAWQKRTPYEPALNREIERGTKSKGQLAYPSQHYQVITSNPNIGESHDTR